MVAVLHHSLVVRTTVPSCRLANIMLGAESKETAKLRDARQVE